MLTMCNFSTIYNANIYNFFHYHDRKLYGVTNNDTIFVTSPPTFDPFMVDVCLALHYGASLVMVDHKLRCDAKKLLDILFSHKQHSNITIMQMTPSLFMHWTSDDIKHRIFSSISKLRILALGGERFPTTNLLRKWMNWEILSTDSMCRVFNLYGLTEMSCWAGVYELTKDDILENRTIPIGQPIDEYTAFQVSADGELLLKSTVRKCFQLQLTDEQVTDNQFEFILHTGDLVDFENGTFYFTSRTNSIVKFYGQKINLSEIEQCAKNVDKVEDVACFHDENHNSIVLFVKTNEHIHTMKEQIQKALRKVNVYVKVYFVTEFPLTMHGKICENDLLNLVVECNNETVSTLESIQSIFLKLINESIGTTIQALDIESQQTSKKLKMECDSSFIELGGSSLKAIQIVNELESITSQTNTFLLLMLLDEKVSIREILSKLSNEKLSIQSSVSNQSTNSSPIIPEINPFWKINMEKCIDATPTVCKLRNGDVIVSVGSHSKLLYNIFLATGEIISKLEFPDRIESQVVQMDDDGIVGCYDGHLYCFDIRTGTIKWKSDSGAMIKCRALLMDSLILFGNYNESHNFWCLNTSNGLLKYCLKIGLKSIYANPVKINDENCLVCSLDGTVAQVNSFTAQILWMFDAKAPIFSTPTIFLNSLNEQQIILATVNGIIYLLTIDGICTSDHQIDGNIFSSFEYFPNFEVSETCIDFIIGSQNRFLYCISIDKMGICSEAWRILTSASIRSNPVFIRKNQNWLAAIFSSDGVVNVIDCHNGKLIQQNRIDGDVFSSPVIYDERLIVGSRNNFLYCIGLNSLIGNKSVFDGS